MKIPFALSVLLDRTWGKDTHLEAWTRARSLADVGDLTALWLEGHVKSQPAYEPDAGPDGETAPLVPVLAALNRAGYVTISSQPGYPPKNAYDGQLWEQRAAVEGFASETTVRRIFDAAGWAGVCVIAHDPATLPARDLNMDREVTVTLHAGYDHTWFGAQIPRADLRHPEEGYGALHEDAVNALCAAWQVTVYDPEWGRGDRLWPVLAGALGCEVRS